jgi:hypothetical protein
MDVKREEGRERVGTSSSLYLHLLLPPPHPALALKISIAEELIAQPLGVSRLEGRGGHSLRAVQLRDKILHALARAHDDPRVRGGRAPGL